MQQRDVFQKKVILERLKILSGCIFVLKGGVMNGFMSRLNKIKYFILGVEVSKELILGKLRDKIGGKLSEDGGNWLDESFKYILAVVIGLAFLAGLYAITKDTILPILTQKIKDGFNFK